MLTYILRASSRLCLVALILASAPLHCAIAQPQTAPSSQSAPPSQFASVADEVAATLTRAKAKRVVVFDFVYPYSAEWDRVGEQLAADFRLSLDATPHKFTQVDRDEILTWMKRDSIDQNQFAFSSVGIYASRDAQVDGWVFVELQPDDSRVKLTFNVYTGKKGGSSKSFSRRDSPNARTQRSRRSLASVVRPARELPRVNVTRHHNAQLLVLSGSGIFRARQESAHSRLGAARGRGRYEWCRGSLRRETRVATRFDGPGDRCRKEVAV